MEINYVLISNADLSLFRASATIDSSSYPQLVDDAMQSIAEHCTGLQSDITDAGLKKYL